MLIVSKGIRCISELEWLGTERKCSAVVVGLDLILEEKSILIK